MSSFLKPNREIGDRTYIVAVLLGLDGSYTVRALRHPEATPVYWSSAIGGILPGALQRPFERAARYIEEDVVGQGKEDELPEPVSDDVVSRVARWAYEAAAAEWSESAGIATGWESLHPDTRSEWISGAATAIQG